MYLRFYFKKLYFNRFDYIADNTPVLIASNHNNAFADALVLGSLLSKLEMHFIVRGDVFNKRMLWFFRKTNQIPIFRFRDGYENMKKNNDTMEYCYEALSKNQRIIIFSEGDCSTDMRLRTIQKGTARMAFGTYEKYKPSNILIYPVGINYIEPTRMRSSIMVHGGDPIHVNNYYELYNQNPNKAIKELTDEIQLKMADHVLSIEDYKSHDVARKAIEIIDNSHQAPLLALKKNETLFRRIQSWLATHNKAIREEDFQWQEELNLLEQTFKQNRIKSRLPLLSENLYTQIFLALLLLPIGLPAMLYFSIPNLLSLWLVKTKKISPSFITSIRIGASFGFLMIQVILTFLLIGFLTKWKFALFFLILASFVAKLGQIWWHAFHFILQRVRWGKMSRALRASTMDLMERLNLIK